MANADLKTFYVKGWTGGWQPDVSKTQLQPEMVTDLMNVVFGEGYSIAKRRGFARYGLTTNIGGGC